MRSVDFLSLSTSSTSSGALCSMGDATFTRPMSPSGMFPSYAMMQFCTALPN